MIGIILIITAIYLGIGFAFALVFVSRGVQLIDEGAKEAGIGFRILIIPGSSVFWPLLLRRWIRNVKKSNHDQVTS